MRSVSVKLEATRTRRGETAAAVALLLAAAIVFAVEQRLLASVNGLWLDEYFSIWASDVARPFADVFIHRIWPDSNPPLYFSALYAVRLLVPDPRSAMTALNVAALCATALITFLSARRNALPPVLWSACFSLFLISGPVLRYTAEGRSYLIGMCLSFLASWYSVCLIYKGRRHVGLPALALTGVAAALTHVFAALICCSLAAGLFVLATARGRRDLYAPAFALGLSAGLTTLAWMLFALSHVGNISWIQVDGASLKAVIWEMRVNAFGFWIVAAPAALLAGLSATWRPTRDIVAAFLVAFAVFLAVPLAASLKMPMVTARYWLIGAPALLVMLSFIPAAIFAEGRRRSSLATVLSGALFATFFVASAVGGRSGAMTLLEQKPTWVQGTTIAREHRLGCPERSVAVIGEPPIYALASGLPENIFYVVDRQAPPVRPPMSCEMIGWAEHLNLSLYPSVAGLTPETAPADKLLDLFRLEIDPASVDIRRHASGVVILRRRPTTP